MTIAAAFDGSASAGRAPMRRSQIVVAGSALAGPLPSLGSQATWSGDEEPGATVNAMQHRSRCDIVVVA